MIRNPMTDWMAPPDEQEPGEFERRWNVAPDRRMPVAEAYKLGGLAAMDDYSEANAPAVYGAYDKAKREEERRAKILATPMPGTTAQAPMIERTPESLARDRAMMELGRDMLVPQTPLDVGLMVAGGPVGGKLLRGGAAALGALFEPDEAEAGKLPRLPKGVGGKKAGKATENWRLSDAPPPGGHNRPPPEARFPQYAEEYPPVGPPEWTFDPKKKEHYWAKDLTPEAKVFQKERAKIMKDMAKEGYDPFFDAAQRYHVDPANYPPNVDTTTIIPKKQATIDKHMENIGSEEARERLRTAYQRGTELPNTADWYALGQLEAEFIKELGPVAGRKAFQDRIATSMAATTGGADPTSNWLMAHYGNYLRNKGLPVPEASHQYPFPIGGRYASGNMAMHEKVFDQGGFAGLGEANPKRHNFSQNFTGNRGAATMDEQMTSGMTPGVNIPPAGTYGLYEKVLGEEAAKVGVQPQNYQDVGWAGFKNLKDPTYTAGKPFIEHINESIERTHRLTGMPKDEILRRGIIKGEIPMYAVMGAVGLGAVADQSGYAR